EAAGDGHHARKRNRDPSQGNALRSRKGDGLLGEVIGGSKQEDQREEKASQNDHRSLPKAYCLHIFGNCDRLRCHVLPPFVRLSGRPCRRDGPYLLMSSLLK